MGACCLPLAYVLGPCSGLQTEAKQPRSQHKRQTGNLILLRREANITALRIKACNRLFWEEPLQASRTGIFFCFGLVLVYYVHGTQTIRGACCCLSVVSVLGPPNRQAVSIFALHTEVPCSRAPCLDYLLLRMQIIGSRRGACMKRVE